MEQTAENTPVNFSIASMIRTHTEPHNTGVAKVEKLLLDVSNKRSGRIGHGFTLPTEYMGRAVSVSGDPGLPAEQEGSFVRRLQDESVIFRAGAQLLDDLSGTVKIPTVATGATSEWVAEGVAPTNNELTGAAISLVPKTCAIHLKATRQLLQQSDADKIITDDIISEFASQVDRVALVGGSTDKEPVGLMNDSNVPSISAAGALTWAKVAETEKTARANGAKNLALFCSPAVLEKGQTIEKATGSGFIFSDGKAGTMPIYVVAGMPADKLIVGDFSKLLVGRWGELEIIVNKYNVVTGTVSYNGFMEADVAAKQPKAFCILDTI